MSKFQPHLLNVDSIDINSVDREQIINIIRMWGKQYGVTMA